MGGQGCAAAARHGQEPASWSCTPYPWILGAVRTAAGVEGRGKSLRRPGPRSKAPRQAGVTGASQANSTISSRIYIGGIHVCLLESIVLQPKPFGWRGYFGDACLCCFRLKNAKNACRFIQPRRTLFVRAFLSSAGSRSRWRPRCEERPDHFER